MAPGRAPWAATAEAQAFQGSEPEDQEGGAGSTEREDQQKWLRGFGELLGLSENLNLTPKIVDGRAAADTTAGLEYSYDRRITSFRDGASEVYLRSSGTLVADEAATPERRLQHRLEVSIVDLFGSYSVDYARRKDPENGDWRRLVTGADARLGAFRRDYYVPWQTADPAERPALYEQALAAWREMGGETLTVVAAVGDGDPSWLEMEESAPIPGRKPFVTLVADFGAESDQQFGDVQYVGTVGLRGKWHALGAPLDYVMQHIRGYEIVRDYRNFDAGPYFWAGVDFVDTSQNETRAALVTTTDDERFARLNIGASYRNELFDLGTEERSRPVALELEARYYLEVGAPAAVKAADQDETSWFRATIVLPDNLIIEYTDGRQPLDLASRSTVFVGWRFGKGS